MPETSRIEWRRQYVALLRAITNVSMKSFRDGMADLGFTDVESYGMSGNLLFNSQRSGITAMEQQITERFGTPAIVRTRSQLRRVITQDPFGSSILFLVRVPSAAKRRAFSQLDFESPRPVLYGKTVFYIHPARLKDKRAPFDFEQALGVQGTARSARVVRRILARMSRLAVNEPSSKRNKQ